MTPVEAVRLKAADRSTITRETDKSNGDTATWKLGHENVVNLTARKNTILLANGVDYTLDAVNGLISISGVIVNDELEFTYYWSVFSDDEIQYFIDEAGGNVTIATASLLLAWAADAARLAKRQTLSGGGGLGQVVVDTSVAAKELRATAKALIDNEQDIAEAIPAEGLTEVPWTEANYKRMVDQEIIRNN